MYFDLQESSTAGSKVNMMFFTDADFKHCQNYHESFINKIPKPGLILRGRPIVTPQLLSLPFSFPFALASISFLRKRRNILIKKSVVWNTIWLSYATSAVEKTYVGLGFVQQTFFW